MSPVKSLLGQLPRISLKKEPEAKSMVEAVGVMSFNIFLERETGLNGATHGEPYIARAETSETVG